MTSPRLARALDEAFIRWALRPTLPTVLSTSRLARLQQAEQRTAVRPADDRLFAPLAVAPVRTLDSRSVRGRLSVTTRECAAPTIPLERDWNMASNVRRPARCRFYERPSHASLLIAVAGWVPCRSLLEQALWPVAKLHAIGFDVAMPELWGASAREPRTLTSPFPSADPSRNVIELARGATLLRQWIAFARDTGYPRVVVWGTSLGAHVAALLATVAPPIDVDAMVLETPLVRLSDPLLLHARGPLPMRESVALRLNRVYRAVTALERQPKIDASKLRVIGALYDKVTPYEDAERLAAHFGSSLVSVEASHTYAPKRWQRFVEVLGST